MNNYSHIDYSERVSIQTYLSLNFSVNDIAFKLKRAKSTIYNELNKFKNTKKYNAEIADSVSVSKRQNASSKKSFEKFEKFKVLFKIKFDKNFNGVEATVAEIRQQNPDIEIPCVKTVYNWIASGQWIISKVETLRPKYVKGGKRGSRKNTEFVVNDNVNALLINLVGNLKPPFFYNHS